MKKYRVFLCSREELLIDCNTIQVDYDKDIITANGDVKITFCDFIDKVEEEPVKPVYNC